MQTRIGDVPQLAVYVVPVVTKQDPVLQPAVPQGPVPVLHCSGSSVQY
jgi:hypothetical protein